MGEFAGKTAVVAGGSTGIGKAAARGLADAGARVVLCGRTPETVAAAEAELLADGLDAVGIVADVSRAPDVANLFVEARRRFDGVDILVNSAGIQRYGTVEETDEGLWDEVMAVNLKAMYLTARAAIPEMRRRGGGVIVNVSSVQGLATQKGVAAYSTSKAAINGLTRALAVDHAHEGIRAVAVCPASVDTPMLRWSADLFKGDATAEETLTAWGRMHPLGRIATPEEVAAAIVFLASPRASFITGAEIKVDGGMMAALGVLLPE